jgi:hypothetical protein
MQRSLASRQVWRSSPGYDDVSRRGGRPTERARELECYQRTHAVSEKGEREIERGLELLAQDRNQCLEAGERTLAASILASRELHGAQLEIDRDHVAPRAEYVRTAPRVWEAEQPPPDGIAVPHAHQPRRASLDLHEDSSIFWRRLSGRMSVQTSLI